MSVVLDSPRFRTTERLVRWARRVRLASRLRPESERCFFRSKESPEKISRNLVRYSDHVGDLGGDFEALILNRDALGYIKNLRRLGVAPKPHLLDLLEPRELVHLASCCGRLGERWEERVADAGMLAAYAECVGELPRHLEERIVEPEQVMRYVKVLWREDREVPEFVFRKLAGQDRYFLDIARRMGRLPGYLEETIGDPHMALNYAVYILKGRLPEGVEWVISKDPEVAARYAFEVIRAFSSPRLPDFLHNAVMLAGAGSNNETVKRYLVEVERTSKKTSDAGA